MLPFIIAVIVFIVADIIIRAIIKKSNEKRQRREREQALAEHLNLDFTHEAKTLKRVEVENPKARILAVDDEEIILSSFRKILVLDGYSVDTVETGQEALGLIQKHHYDFVFTDLKMPEMDGVEVCKAVKHLRPDIDVVIITGYASVETAVETMKYGAMDYVQKPFTEEELLEFVKTIVIKREEKIKKQLKPKVNIKRIDESEYEEKNEFVIPGGVFISEGHCWISLLPVGVVEIGIDDFAKKIIGHIDDIEFPNLGMKVKKGDHLFSIKKGTRTIPFAAPLSGMVSKVNQALADDPEQLDITPYDKSWICELDPSAIEKELAELNIGEKAVAFFQEEIEKFSRYAEKYINPENKDAALPPKGQIYVGEIEDLGEKEWEEIATEFFAK